MKKENKIITKKQHYVPKFYLKNFTNQSGQIQILDSKNNRLCSPKSCSGIAYSPFFYAVETGVSDEISQHIEQWLKQFEDVIAREIPYIINRILDNKHIDSGDRHVLSVFMCMLWLRSPNMRTKLNKMEESMRKKVMKFYTPERVDNFVKESGLNMSEKEHAKLVKMIETGSYSLRFNNASHLKLMTETLGFDGPGFANMFFGQKWKIYIAKGKKRFITSDGPVVEWWLPPKTFYGASFLERNKYFALTPEILFELTYPKGVKKAKRRTIFEKDDDIVSLFNILLASHAHKFIYSNNKETLNSIISGRTNPGTVEIDYYKRFEQPWKEYRRENKE